MVTAFGVQRFRYWRFRGSIGFMVEELRLKAPSK